MSFFLKPINDHQIAKQIVLDYTKRSASIQRMKSWSLLAMVQSGKLIINTNWKLWKIWPFMFVRMGNLVLLNPLLSKMTAPKEIRDKKRKSNKTIHGKRYS